jgi:hypothetical protein
MNMVLGKKMKKLIGMLVVLFICVVSMSSQAQISEIFGVNTDSTPTPPPPPCSTFNISGPLSSLDVGATSEISELGFRVVPSLGTFGVSFKKVIGGGTQLELHLKVGTLSPLSLIVDNLVITWTLGEVDFYVIGASANGYVLHFLPLAFSQPFNRRTVAYSAENGSLLGIQNFTSSVAYQVFSSESFGQTFDGGRYYTQGRVSATERLMVAWNHGVASTSPIPSSINALFGFGYDGVSKIFTFMNVNDQNNPQRVVHRWAKFNGVSTDFETQNDITGTVGQIGGFVFGNNKIYISENPQPSVSLGVHRLSTNLAVEQSAFLQVGDGALYTGSRAAYDQINNKLYVISNVSGGVVGRRIFRVNPTNLSIEQAFTVVGGGLGFQFSDANFWVSDNGRKAWTLESDSGVSRFIIREWSLCS